ncbi:MAG TPA: Crp/Fnr family transcriptional regulator [Solirubrobacteraceae bacterium]|nr:Crp/Fnr family transcriptional regulator [Solirubrobacteraceae bacterium]
MDPTDPIRSTSRASRIASTRAWHPVIDLASDLLGEPPGEGQIGRRLNARVVHLPPGEVGFPLGDEGEDWIGLLILDGMLVTSLRAGRAHTAWLLGAEDFIRPWDMSELVFTRHAGWRALEPTRVALLDREFGMRAGGVPIVARALAARASHTTTWLLAKALVASAPVVEERLLLLFALLGERWGTVSAEGVTVHVPLTHAVLAELCGARRPSVTTALHRLQHGGFLSRTADGGWLLRRDHAGSGGAPGPACVPEYDDALGLAWPARA